MNLRFIQRQPGGPKVLQVRTTPKSWVWSPDSLGDGEWQDIPLIEEWRAEPAKTSVYSPDDSPLYSPDDSPAARRLYHDMD